MIWCLGRRTSNAAPEGRQAVGGRSVGPANLTHPHQWLLAENEWMFELENRTQAQIASDQENRPIYCKHRYHGLTYFELALATELAYLDGKAADTFMDIFYSADWKLEPVNIENSSQLIMKHLRSNKRDLSIVCRSPFAVLQFASHFECLAVANTLAEICMTVQPVRYTVIAAR